MPIFIIIASAFALICTVGLALPVILLVVVAFACRRPPELHDPLAIAMLPGRRCTQVEAV